MMSNEFGSLETDARGWSIGINSRIDYIAYSKLGVIRGLHGQHGQRKKVFVLQGAIRDIIASEVSGIWTPLYMSAGDSRFVERDVLHGYEVVAGPAIVAYWLSSPANPAAFGYRYDDPFFNIEWLTQSPILSEQDASWPRHP